MPPRAFRQSLGHTLDFIRDLDRARNLEDVSAQVLRHVAPFGAEYVLAGTMPEVGSSYRQQLGHVLLAKWPEDWESRYFSQGRESWCASIFLERTGSEITGRSVSAAGDGRGNRIPS